jgi:predicted alpha/beta hydrolase family esterase
MLLNQEQTVLVLPGLRGSRPSGLPADWAHVDQHDWDQPLRGDWIARLEDVLLATPAPAVLVAHGLGCALVLAWAAVSRSTDRIRGAVLLEPVDLADKPLRSWPPLPFDRLPFPSVVLHDARGVDVQALTKFQESSS